MQRRPPSALSSFAVALGATAVAVLVRALLVPWMGHSAPFMTLYGAIAIAVWYGGYVAGVVAMTLGFVACDYFFREPAFVVTLTSDFPTPVLYLVTGAIIIVLGEAMRRAQRRAEAGAEQLRVTVGSIGDAVVTTDADADITYLNAAAESLTGWTEAEAIGRPIGSVFQILDEGTRAIVESPVTRSMQEGTVPGPPHQGLLVLRDGSERPVEDSAAAIRSADGRVVGNVVVFRDLSSRRQLQHLEHDLQRQLEQKVAERTADLRASEERFRLLVEGTQDYAIFMLDPDGRVASWNPGAERIKQYRADEIVGQHFSRFYPPRDIASGKPQRGLEIAATEGRFADEGFRVRKDGTQFWASVVITALRDAAGRLRGFSKVTRDVTDRKASEENARRLLQEETARHTAEQYAFEVDRRRQELQLTLASIGDGVITTDASARVILLNPVAEALTGWTQDEGAGRDLTTVFHIVNERTRQAVVNPVSEVLAGGEARGLANHTVLIARDGSERPIDDSAAPIRDREGRILGCVLIFRDVSEHRRMEKENAERLATARVLAAIVSSSDDAIISKSLDGIIQSWNVAAERIFGYSAEEAIGRHITLIIPPDRVAEENEIVARLRDGQRVDHFETVRVRRDGELIDVSLTISPIRDPDGRVVGASKIARDISARKKSEEMLRENEERLRLATQTGKVGVWEWDVSANRLSWTDSLFAIHGIAKDAFGGTVEAFTALIHPDDRPRLEAAIEQALAGATPYEVEVRAVKPDGEVIWIFTNALVVKSQGQPVRMVGVTVDITARRRAEEALKEADRRKDEFLATLAHELRNPLAPISNAVQVLAVTGPTDADLQWGRDVINRQVKQMARLLDDLLDVSRISYNKLELRRERIDLAAVIRSAVETSSPLIDDGGHHLVIDLPAKPVWLDGDPIRLAQVFSNLLNNAAKYTRPGGHIAIAGRLDGDDVVVTVKDDGIGISAEMLPRLFQIFSQAKPALERSQGGLGIGLSLVRGVVELHGGTIAARSEGPECGSEFTVRLPVAARDLGAAPEPRIEQSVARAESAARAEGAARAEIAAKDAGAPKVEPRRILVVDDLVDSADSLSILLQMMGHEVHTAYDGEQGIAAAEEHQPEVVLLDIGLPKLNGYDVCRRIRQQPWGKAMFLIALTGWGQEDDRRRTLEAGFDRHLVKPVDLATLGHLLASLPQQRTAE